MKSLAIFFVCVVTVASSSAQTLPLPPAPQPATGTATNTEASSAVTNPPEAVVLQQLMEKIEKLETKTETQASEQVDKLKLQLSEAEANLRLRETEAANRVILYVIVFVVIALAALSIVGLVVYCIYSFRRLTDISAPILESLNNQRQPALPALPYGSPAGTLPPHTGVVEAAPINAVATRGETRLLDAVDRLERKIEEIERVAHHDNHIDSNLGGARSSAPIDPARNHRHADRFVLLLNKGEAHANLQQFAKAIECFEQAGVLAPNDPAPLVKKGYAIEKLGRLDEAMQCYDQALLLDPSYTMAYLFKGGICNRLQRYAEAIECYDRALALKPNDALGQ